MILDMVLLFSIVSSLVVIGNILIILIMKKTIGSHYVIFENSRRDLDNIMSYLTITYVMILPKYVFVSITNNLL